MQIYLKFIHLCLNKKKLKHSIIHNNNNNNNNNNIIIITIEKLSLIKLNKNIH